MSETGVIILESAVPGDEGPLATERSNTSEKTLDLKAEPIAGKSVIKPHRD